MRTIVIAHSILAATTPVTGTVSNGLVHVSSRAGAGEVRLPKRTIGFPIVVSASGRGAMDPNLPVRIAEEMIVDEVGGECPVQSVWGSPAYNLPEGTRIRWWNPPAGIEDTSELVAGGMTGAVAGAAKSAVIYEGLASEETARDLWLATGASTTNYPAVVLWWDGSTAGEPTGNRRLLIGEKWTLAVVVGRLDGAVPRLLEGKDILDKLLGRFVNRASEPLGPLSGPFTKILGRRRLRVDVDSYVYTLQLQTNGVVERDDDTYPEGRFNPWETTTILAETPTPPGDDPPAPLDVTGRLAVDMTAETPPNDPPADP